MKLAPTDLQQISAALLDAFSPNSLASMLNAQLGIRLSDITAAADFPTMVGKVIADAERKDQVDALVAGAKATVPTNRKLKALPDTFADAGRRSADHAPQAETGNTGNGGITINAGTANIDNSQFAGQDMINTFSTGDEALHTGDKRRDEQYETARNWSGESMRDFDLSGRNLDALNLNGADLINVNLQHASLVTTGLQEARLIKADLSHADLSYADLSHANLVRASLEKTRLKGAILTSANLSGADLSGATYDADTKWPDGYDPAAAGAVKLE
ncbi:MAG: pentapeptide repeat-containing protein [Anaerolineae bacterium]|nr:pentapeptide repeat-containing protein [Anaerolineae bacterium]